MRRADGDEEGLFCWGLCFYCRTTFWLQSRRGALQVNGQQSSLCHFHFHVFPGLWVHLPLHTGLQVSHNCHLPISAWALTLQTLFKMCSLQLPQDSEWQESVWIPLMLFKALPFPLDQSHANPSFVFPCSLGLWRLDLLIFWVSCSDGIARLYFKGTVGNVWYSQSSSWARRRIILESSWGKLVGLNWHTPLKEGWSIKRENTFKNGIF